MTPNYIKIYTDLISESFPQKLSEPTILEKLNRIQNIKDVIAFNNMLFQSSTNIRKNQRLRSYDGITMKKILDYQKCHNLSNTCIAQKYHISRNTIAKWKKAMGTEA